MDSKRSLATRNLSPYATHPFFRDFRSNALSGGQNATAGEVEFRLAGVRQLHCRINSTGA
jgi:hypothetical protein